MAFVAVFSTPDNITRKQALASWNEQVSKYLTELEILSKEQQSFYASIEVIDIGCLRLATPRSTPSMVSHSNRCLSQAGKDSYLLHLQIRGRSLNQQSGYEAVLDAGDYTLCDTGRTYHLEFDTLNDMLVVVIPKQELKRRIANPEIYSCITMPGNSGISGVVSQMLQNVWLKNRNQDFGQYGEKLAGNILDLLATSYGTLSGARVQESSVVTARRIMIRDLIEQNLYKPELSPVFIAGVMKYSVAYVHELFKGEGESISRYIMRRRLEEAAKALCNPQMKSVSVSYIAFQYGFKNVTHFGRLFKQQFGCTPGNYR